MEKVAHVQLASIEQVGKDLNRGECVDAWLMLLKPTDCTDAKEA